MWAWSASFTTAGEASRRPAVLESTMPALLTCACECGVRAAARRVRRRLVPRFLDRLRQIQVGRLALALFTLWCCAQLLHSR